ncbi:1,3-beta-glucanosyltransferase gas1 [Pseudogymnoascus australis]
MHSYSLLAVAFLAVSDLVAGHGAIISATGDQGGTGSAIGIDPATPRDGTRRNPFQQDTTRFRGDAADACGETLGGGDNDAETGTAAVMQLSGDQLPQISPGGQVSMTLHQVNGDGAGPYTCMIDATGTGTNWVSMEVTTNVPGRRGRDRDGEETDFPLVANVAAGQTCTGSVAGQENVCMVRCENPARAGPFGGCVPVQMAGAAGNATDTAAAVGSSDATAAVTAASTEATGTQLVNSAKFRR